ncbi:uncharacterized protein AB675_7538 [Cyphellophora attinorum]|uniref:Homeobox domain-containing protein n=1 Tax=Cyphellophora attinorum TaxID=1664694 RepID=A0A0N1H4M6_9EURO|nr:uncharacterized protein AB675_7538 [Phialophora attinorum]KPI40270.1 hypothetical protein AB675_7538 [Phialophora attinorum]
MTDTTIPTSPGSSAGFDQLLQAWIDADDSLTGPLDEQFKLSPESVEADSYGQQMLNTEAVQTADSSRPKQRQRFSDAQKALLNNWVLTHLDDPYLSTAECADLTQQTQLSATQVRMYVSNFRRRKLNKGDDIARELGADEASPDRHVSCHSEGSNNDKTSLEARPPSLREVSGNYTFRANSPDVTAVDQSAGSGQARQVPTYSDWTGSFVEWYLEASQFADAPEQQSNSRLCSPNAEEHEELRWTQDSVFLPDSEFNMTVDNMSEVDNSSDHGLLRRSPGSVRSSARSVGSRPASSKSATTVVSADSRVSKGSRRGRKAYGSTKRQASIAIVSASGYPSDTNIRVSIEMLGANCSKEILRTKAIRSISGNAEYDASHENFTKVNCLADAEFQVLVKDTGLFRDHLLGHSIFFVSDQEEGFEQTVNAGQGTVVIRSSFEATENIGKTSALRCPICRKSFARPYTLRRHVTSVHSEQQAWICRPVNDFESKRYLLCPVCSGDPEVCSHSETLLSCWNHPDSERTFYRKDAMREHLRRMHGLGSCMMPSKGPAVALGRALCQFVSQHESYLPSAEELERAAAVFPEFDGLSSWFPGELFAAARLSFLRDCIDRVLYLKAAGAVCNVHCPSANAVETSLYDMLANDADQGDKTSRQSFNRHSLELLHLKMYMRPSFRCTDCDRFDRCWHKALLASLTQNRPLGITGLLLSPVNFVRSSCLNLTSTYLTVDEADRVLKLRTMPPCASHTPFASQPMAANQSESLLPGHYSLVSNQSSLLDTQIPATDISSTAADFPSESDPIPRDPRSPPHVESGSSYDDSWWSLICRGAPTSMQFLDDELSAMYMDTNESPWGHSDMAANDEACKFGSS